MVADAMQEKLLWASELPGEGRLLCTALMDEPQKGTAPGASSLGCVLLLLCLLKFVIYLTCMIGHGRPSLPVVWYGCLLGDSRLYWAIFLQISMKMDFHKIALFG